VANHHFHKHLCTADGGCSYLQTLSALEHLAGFGDTARLFEDLASVCRQRGCWAGDVGDACSTTQGATASPSNANVAAFRYRSAGRAKPPKGTKGAIPFARSSLVERRSDDDGNWLEQRHVDFAALAPTDPLSHLYTYWRTLRDTTPCRFTDIDPGYLVRAGVIGKLHVVDVRSDDPADFRYEVFAYAVPLRACHSPSDIPFAIYSQSALRDYNTVRFTAVPRLQRIRAQTSEARYHYTRLILPFLDDRQRVSHLAVAIRREAGDGIPMEHSCRDDFSAEMPEGRS